MIIVGLHLVRLGYRYLSLKNASWDEETNIFPELFHTSIARINPGIEVNDITRLLADVKLTLDNEDLGKAFYEKLTERSGIRLIDFADFGNNSFHVVTELIHRYAVRIYLNPAKSNGRKLVAHEKK